MSALGIPALLLKGPVTGRVAYGASRPRAYGDTDVLIRSQDAPRVGEALAALGFRPQVAGPEDSLHSRNYVRGSAAVDVHTAVPGVRAAPPDLWAELDARAATIAIDGVEVRCVDDTFAALHVVLHAAQHGAGEPKPLRDLAQLLAVRPRPQDWAEVVALAARLDAHDALTAGLRLDPLGQDLADRLGLGEASDPGVRLRAGSAPPLAVGLSTWLERPTLGRLLRAALPTPTMMRIRRPVARRGRFGLVAAYLTWPAWLAWRGLAAVTAVIRARSR